MLRIFVFSLFLFLLQGCSGGYVARTDEDFLSRQMLRIHACFDENIKKAIANKDFEVSNIYKRCEALTYTYDQYVMIGKSKAFRDDYLNFQLAKWYSEILNRIDVVKRQVNPLPKSSGRPSHSDPLYFYSQLKGRLRIMEISFGYCDFGSGNIHLYKQSLSDYSELILFAGELIDLELQLKNRNYKSLIKEFDLIAIKELDKSIVSLFSDSKRESSCQAVRKQFIGQDRELLSLVNDSINTIDGTLLNHPKIQPVLKKVRARIKSINEALDKKSA